MRAEPVVLAQLTDTHVSVGDHGPGAAHWAENRRRLGVAVRALNAETERPAVVIGTGDLVECGSQPAYDELVKLMADLELPFWPLPGNHDSSVRLRAAFPHMPWEQNHASWVQTVPETTITVIGLDSTTPGESGGHVDLERLDWLAENIEAAAGPTVLAMHHPPFVTGIDWMDALGFKGLEQLQQVLTAHPPTRIIAGHFHRSIVTQVGHCPASVGISTTLHVNLDLSNAAVPAVINDPIGYELHCVLSGDDPQVITHTRHIDRASVPHPIQL
ncbi:MAG: metallophosphoesterase [Acidimicrobiales bacterium]